MFEGREGGGAACKLCGVVSAAGCMYTQQVYIYRGLGAAGEVPALRVAGPAPGPSLVVCDFQVGRWGHGVSVNG